MILNEVIGLVFIVIGTIFVGIGIIGLYKFHDFYSRASIASIIDTSGFILLIIGAMIYQNLSLFSLKVTVILFFMLFLNPLSNHIIVRGAHRSGFHTKKGD